MKSQLRRSLRLQPSGTPGWYEAPVPQLTNSSTVVVQSVTPAKGTAATTIDISPTGAVTSTEVLRSPPTTTTDGGNAGNLTSPAPQSTPVQTGIIAGAVVLAGAAIGATVIRSRSRAA